MKFIKRKMMVMPMVLDLAVVMQALTIVSLSCGIIKLFIVNPLSDSINTLSSQVKELQDAIHKTKSEQHIIDKRLVKIEEHSRAIDKRIDVLARGDSNA